MKNKILGQYLIFIIYIHIIDYSDFTLSLTRSTTAFVQSLYDYTPHSLNILCTRLVQLSIFTKEALNSLSI